jgi:hypothetical protein
MYENPFFITAEESNNAFSFARRNNPRLYVPMLVEGSQADVERGDEVVFEDFDDGGNLQSCRGLKNYVRIQKGGKVIYVFDNHNHAFSFWHKELFDGNLRKGAHVVHVDQHRDTRIPPSFLAPQDAMDEDGVFKYANTVLNVGNFIPAAIKTGLVKDVTFICSAQNIEDFNIDKIDKKNLILDIDLDFFTPDLDYIGNAGKLDLLKVVGKYAKVVTFATSPFFIDQELAIEWFRKTIIFL